MALKIVRNDITKMRCDAIVNTANEYPVVGAGCDSAVYEAAGYSELLAYRKKHIGHKNEGEVFITPGFNLSADYIIHAVSPAYRGGSAEEEQKLRSCYRKSLQMAEENHIRSIAFPLIATGSYHYPKEEGMRIAVDEINAFLLTRTMTVYLVVYDDTATRLGRNIYPDLESYIDRSEQKETLPARHDYSQAIDSGQNKGFIRREDSARDEESRRREDFIHREDSARDEESGQSESLIHRGADIRDEYKLPNVKNPNYYPDRKELASAPKSGGHRHLGGLFRRKNRHENAEYTSSTNLSESLPIETDFDDYIDESVTEDHFYGSMSGGYVSEAEAAGKHFSEETAYDTCADDEQLSVDFYSGHESRLEERLKHASDTFSEYLMFLIESKGMSNTEVYKRAIVDKKVFSKIKNNKEAHPQKMTAMCLCIGARLNIDESRDLLARAGYALSPSNRTDIIFSYFIENHIYDMIELDIQLEEHGLPCLIS